ncbi:16663_t:CDS:2 [Racocetra persica]|uniref:16663_t:CDS:1 n=1 Tax=Racocetra persica TaxID=160502 RepID=A0ACA9KLM9_9GLOM|nr:16663_t:CDS:2 [Racocetra persica]
MYTNFFKYPGFKYLKFFKPKYLTEIANILKERPTLKDIITLVLQNLEQEQEILTEFKVKAIRNDEIRVFDFENKTDIEHG